MNKLSILLKRGFLFIAVLVFSVAFIPTQPTASALTTRCDEVFYEGNDILYYNPCDTTCSLDDSGELKGADNPEKIWNYYSSKGLNPVAIAGIMGNFSQESGFDPAIKQDQSTLAIPVEGDGETGYGIAQWTFKARQAGLFSKMTAEGLNQYFGEGWGASEKNREISAEDVDKLLKVQLDYSWDGDTTQISSLATQLNSIKVVDGDAGSTVVFHNSYEGSADNAAGIKERVDDAVALLERYGESTGDGGCSGALGGVTSIDDAVAWAKKYVSDTQSTYQGKLNVNGSAFEEGDNPKFVYTFGHNSGSYCWGATDCGQCVAVSGWFALTQTTDGRFLHNNGGFIVDNYVDAGLPTGSEPHPYSIFSAKTGGPGHTGVVLGVLDNGEVITVEANWNSSGRVLVWQGNMKERYKTSPVTYAYFEDRLGGDAAKAGL